MLLVVGCNNILIHAVENSRCTNYSNWTPGLFDRSGEHLQDPGYTNNVDDFSSGLGFWFNSWSRTALKTNSSMITLYNVMCSTTIKSENFYANFTNIWKKPIANLITNKHPPLLNSKYIEKCSYLLNKIKQVNTLNIH